MERLLMKKVAILGPRNAGLIDAPDPKPVKDWALVKVHSTPMCTEYGMFLGGRPAQYMGHEAAGEVVEIAQPCRVNVGDRVVVQPQYPCGKCQLCVTGDFIHCQNNHNFDQFTGGPEGKATYAQYILKPSWLLSPIPDDVSYDYGSLAVCALGPSYEAFKKMGVRAYDNVLITGLGPVGLGAVVNARFLNARVIGVDLEPWRQTRAAQMGAEAVLDPRNEDILDQIRGLTNGIGVDYALDCSGNVNAERLCIDATRRRGKVAYVGECGAQLSIRVSPDLIRKGLTVMGSWHYNLGGAQDIMRIVQRSDLIELLISHRFPMSKIQEAFETSASKQCAKIILHPWE